jgi:hypothetical protein
MSQSKCEIESARRRGILREDPLAPWYNYEDKHSTPSPGDVDHWLHRRQDNVQFSPRKFEPQKPAGLPLEALLFAQDFERPQA